MDERINKLPKINSKKDGKRMIYIPEGEFIMGSGDEEHSVNLQGFWISETPVTNDDFKRFVDEKKYQPKYWEYEPGKADHPAVNVTWYDAVEYAKWAGGKLPSEAQWEKAARGTDGRKYPWGNEFDSKKCNTWESGIDGTTPVGTYPDGASPYGVLDMAGNVWEWTSKSDNNLYFLRGGSWNLIQVYARCSTRDLWFPDFWNGVFGFRIIFE
jgi:formylglycine-generating enzyme required for sulfatase activity